MSASRRRVLPIIRASKNVGTFWDIARHQAINANMQMCIDLGDAACIATAADQTLVNQGVAGSSPNLTLGIDTSGGTDDPAYFGTPGARSANERLIFDGGDFCRQTNPGGAQIAWIQRMHADNAIFAMAFWCYFAQISAINGLFSTFDGNASVRGTYFRVTAAGNLQLLISNGSGSLALNVQTTAVIPIGRPVFLAVAVDEAAGTGLFQIDGSQESFVSTYSSPAGSTYGSALRMFSNSGTTHRFQAGNAVYGFWIRESSTLTPAEMMVLYVRSRRRFY